MTPNYGSPYSPNPQPVNFLSDLWGGIQQSWQNENNANMAIDQSYRTGAYAAGAATADAAGNVYHAVADPLFGFAQGALQGAFRGAAVLVGAGIIIVTLINAAESRR